MMSFITQEQPDLFQTLFICFLFFQRRKKRRGKTWFINLLQKLVFYKTMLTKKSEKQFALQRSWTQVGRGSKVLPKQVKVFQQTEVPKRLLFEDPESCCGLRTNNVGEYFEGPRELDGRKPKRCQIAMDCKSFGWESQPFQSGRREPSSPSYRSDLKKIWLNPGVYSTKMANRQSGSNGTDFKLCEWLVHSKSTSIWTPNSFAVLSCSISQSPILTLTFSSSALWFSTRNVVFVGLATSPFDAMNSRILLDR